MFGAYLLQNWPLILILIAFFISLLTSVFLDKSTVKRMYILIGGVFLLSIIVFIEFYFRDDPDKKILRTILMAIRYSATPFIIAQIIFTLVKRLRWFIFIPALSLVVLNIISIFTGIIFSIGEDNMLHRGKVLGFLPFIMVGLYGILLIYLLIKRSNKKPMEIVYIIFLAFALGSGLVLPFIFRDAYASLFCITIAVALFAYFQFNTLQLTNKDALTGLMNRHAYYADIHNDPKSISAVISIDMNGLKVLNDSEGHEAGDKALVTLSSCFASVLTNRQTGYRIGGDEFIIICRKTSDAEVYEIIQKIRDNVAETKYNCAIGYSLNLTGNKTVTYLLRESDKMMYKEKEKFYSESNDRRKKD